ncbi:Protein of unknown function DUF262 [Devosia enhydra]|uniref:GmrSD restriction endonucleases N-terminal domain-containing protein n=1 Tax=Devosia enhydra TaxID=665118 RepID=A0A1K2I314_9HYPH|nr:DUF262 domain-containing protein [Devosia enhydra]SFZ86712.1 Protein of unknown function DUF262 [Devosia enhydra]
MDTPLNASASNAGAIFSNNIFDIPRFQREYSWGNDEVNEFWSDLRSSLDAESYFLGLIILTTPKENEDSGRKRVVDGQQRIITLSLLANAIFHEAIRSDRKALADRIRASFLRSIDYQTDEEIRRVKLTDKADDNTFKIILETGNRPPDIDDDSSVSAKICASYDLLSRHLREDLRIDPFKRLGKWTDFLTNRLYFAVFLHPTAEAAYQVYEVVNTRGRDLTTADLLKNYILSQAGGDEVARYDQWQLIAKQFSTEGANNFVQYIRHVVTVRSGYILPKDLYGFLANRRQMGDRTPPRPNEIMSHLERNLPLYMQMIDPTSAGPADFDALGVFSALNSLNVLTVRPILLACADVPDAQAGREWILKLVVRRIVVGNLGTGNVERRLGEAAKAIHDSRSWTVMIDLLRDLNPTRDEFVSQIKKRSLNKNVLTFLRRSIIQKTITPDPSGFLHFIWTKSAEFDDMGEDEGSYWASTIGNTIISKVEKRPRFVLDWATFRNTMLNEAAAGEWTETLEQLVKWDVPAVERVGSELANEAGRIWYDA